MVAGHYTRQQGQQINPYLMQKIMSASPEQLISYIYDAGITACSKKDYGKASKAVNALISALNFDYKETSLTFLNVYRHLNHLIQKGQFEAAREIFMDIKKTWTVAMKVT
jgi:flagellar protein FliS